MDESIDRETWTAPSQEEEDLEVDRLFEDWF